MRRDGPPVPERVDDVSVPVSVELVLRGALYRRAEFRGAGEDSDTVTIPSKNYDKSSDRRKTMESVR